MEPIDENQMETSPPPENSLRGMKRKFSINLTRCDASDIFVYILYVRLNVSKI